MYTFFKTNSVWAWGGLLIILSSLWGMTQITVKISYWRRSFFDMIQTMITNGGGSMTDMYQGMLEFGYLAGMFVIVAVLTDYLTQRWLLSWRESIMWHYHREWSSLRRVEGASQRLQEDCQKFTRLLENIGEGVVTAIMTLIAFGPILWELSLQIPTLLFIDIEGGLMWAALIWAIGGTLVLVWVGRKLPGLEYNIQRNEASLRKEFVLGEDDSRRAGKFMIRKLWVGVETTHKLLFVQYMRFGLAKWSYLQMSVLVPLVLLSPSIVAGVITFGIIMQTLDAFNRVEQSFQFLLRSWTTIVEYMSVYKRLKEFETKMRRNQ